MTGAEQIADAAGRIGSAGVALADAWAALCRLDDCAAARARAALEAADAAAASARRAVDSADLVTKDEADALDRLAYGSAWEGLR